MKQSKPLVKERESGVELLRIILMLQVIFLHVSNFGEFASINKDWGGLHELVYWVMQTLCRCPVYVFMIISGYFSVTSKTTMQTVWKKAGTVYLPMIFYSLVLTLVIGATGLGEIGAYDIIRSFFPLTSRTWYFMTIYLLVLILSPVINSALIKLSKKDFQILLGVLFFMFSLWQVASSVEPFSKVISVDSVIETTKGRGLDGFLFMYIIGAYLRLHKEREEKIAWKYLFLYVGLAVLDIAVVYATRGVPVLENYAKIVNYNNAPIAVLQGVCLFLFFRTLRFKSRIINRISNHNLGVYMIHEHWLMRPVVWDKIFVATQNPVFYSSPFYLVKVYAIIFIIYVSCWVIDFARGYLFDTVKKLKKR